MVTNLYFEQGVASEQDLYENIVIEALQAYGQDVYYLPRDIVNEDLILGDDIPSRFNSSYRIEMYIENLEGFDGEGDLFTKFGVEIRDQATFVVARKRWTQAVKRLDNEISGERPREGDLIWLPMSKSLFQIMHVEHEQPFYQLKNLPTYKLRCELFEYSGEDFDTGLGDVDAIQYLGYQQILTLTDSADVNFVVGNTVTQSLNSGITVTGEIADYNDSDNTLAVVQVGNDDSDEIRFHMFVTGINIKSVDSDGNTLTRTVSAITEDLAGENEQNEVFRTEGADLIDFTESNPFGEPL